MTSAPVAPGDPTEGSPVAAEAEASPKRAQILAGARRCFLALGFEAASMGQIAREAGVSKGTLYVYFESKEALFVALVEQTKRDSAERLMELDHTDEAPAVTLTRFATQLIRKLTHPDHVALLRMVIGASEKFPAAGQNFFRAGPVFGARRLADYIRAQQALGRLAPVDAEVAAWQFLGMCQHPTVTPVVLGGQAAPDAAETARWAEAAVATFLAAHGR